MRKFALLVCVALILPAMTHATMSTTAWVPIFKGIDHAVGTNTPDVELPRRQSVNCLRIDLTDPDVRLLTSPRHSNWVQNSSVESYALSITNFLLHSGAQVVTAANFYDTPQGSSPLIEGISSHIYGLLVNTGQVVSYPDYGPDPNNRWASLLFTTNNRPFFVWPNSPPGANLAGIFTAVSGYYPVITNGVVPPDDWFASAFPDPTIHSAAPRTVFGVSEDNRFLFLMIIDSRQADYSEGATSREMGLWLQQFGAWNGINMDGGGSTAMYRLGCDGIPQALGHSSYVTAYNRERIVGCQFGVCARPLPSFVFDVTAHGGSTTATIAWSTLTNSTSRVEYGLTPGLGNSTPLHSTLATNHVMTLAGLTPESRYFYRVLSLANDVEFSSTCGQASFFTTNFAGGVIFGLSNTWRYTTENLDGVNWTARDYNDADWPAGCGTLWAYRGSPPSAFTNLIPNFASGCRMPVTATSPNSPYSTYYFRTTFTWSNNSAGAALTFSNYLDDGAVFYLNGTEVFRTNMPAGPVVNGTYTPASTPCQSPVGNGNATCPLVFELSGAALTNVVLGTNIVAVEVHNFRSGTYTPSDDIVFAEALLYSLPPPVVQPPFITNVVVFPGETNAVITWSTLSNASSRIDYGTTPALENSAPTDSTLAMNHAIALQELQRSTQYYFRIFNVSAGRTNTFDGTFSTGPLQSSVMLAINRSTNAICLTWSGPNLKLQQSISLNPPAWTDVTNSPASPCCSVNATGTMFYRLRN